MQPNDFAADCNSLSEQGGVGGDGHAKTRPHEVLLEAFRESWVRHHRREVGHHVLGPNRATKDSREVRQKPRLDIRHCRGGIAPEGKNTAAS
jgi:hypothetical protein